MEAMKLPFLFLVDVLGGIGENSSEVLHPIWDFRVHADT